MRYYWLLLSSLGVWRLTHLLNAEDGPADLLVRLRQRLGQGFWGNLLDCFYCLSLWVATPFALWLGESWGERALLWLALSAAAILLERGTHREPQPLYYEEGETSDAMLQREKTDSQRPER